MHRARSWGKPRAAQCPFLLCDGKARGPYYVTRKTNLGNGGRSAHQDSVTGRNNPGEPTYDNPNSGGYYLTNSWDYRLVDGHGRAMS